MVDYVQVQSILWGVLVFAFLTFVVVVVVVVDQLVVG